MKGQNYFLSVEHDKWIQKNDRYVFGKWICAYVNYIL